VLQKRKMGVVNRAKKKTIRRIQKKRKKKVESGAFLGGLSFTSMTKKSPVKSLGAVRRNPSKRKRGPLLSLISKGFLTPDLRL